MNLDLFKNLINSTKENNIVQNFINELGEALEKNSERNEITLVDKMLNGRKLTASYRDKINIEKGNIISNYSKETSDKGYLYYIYSRNLNNTYNVGIEKDGIYQGDIEVEEEELPMGAGVDSILRVKNGRYLLDEKATEVVQEELIELINRLLEEQDKTLKEQRVEKHLYEFVERSGDSAWLINKTNYTGECFEEIDFPKEVLNKAKEGDIFEYVNGQYQKKF